MTMHPQSLSEKQNHRVNRRTIYEQIQNNNHTWKCIGWAATATPTELNTKVFSDNTAQPFRRNTT